MAVGAAKFARLTLESPAERDGRSPAAAEVELSVVIPCLNEADTLAGCIERAQRGLRKARVDGEIIIADNGSTDGSVEIARAMGVRVVPVAERGYGNALMGGIAAARGKFIVMGDADGSYDFEEIPAFLDKLREGYELVQGCRLPAGGGKVMPGAMPVLHRWIGNPFFSAIARRWFKSTIHDIYCGMRGFTKELYLRLAQRCTGMEFATEMIIKSSLLGARAAEVPITLHKDGRQAHAPHLKTFRDGWRTLRFFLVSNPRRLFLLPGAALMVFGLIAYGLAMPGMELHGVRFDAHTLLFGTLALLCGYQSIFFGVFAKALAIKEGMLPDDPRLRRFLSRFNVELGLVIAACALVSGLALLAMAVNQWRLVDFGLLDYAHTMRFVVPGATLTALGFQTILSAFLVSFLDFPTR
ncbi:MAG TPA: glycosyltransferase family 2 protein [Candidatus Binataceae bacterium]|nr:glycosyltransferase family 2 protein [Candidatus Binataceae bacterium]